MENMSLFWQDLDLNLVDPEFRAEFIRQSVRIATIDHIINALDEAREAQALSKAALARAIGSNPAVVRRLFSAQGNPTLATLSELAAALGLEVALRPIPESVAKSIANVLLGEAGVQTKAPPTRRARSKHRSTIRARHIPLPA